jgi:hypothetical protein
VTRTRRAWTGSIFALVTASSLLLAAPAGASARHTASPRTNHYPFAGYLTSPTTITSSSASVVLPTVSCNKKISAVTATATVFDSSNSSFSSAMAYVGCSSKKESLHALVQIDNAYTEPTVTMNPGDTVSLSVTCGASGISVTVDDVTTSSVGSGSSSTAETCTQAEVGNDAAAFANQSIAPLPHFGSMSFTSVMVNGAAIGSISSSPTTFFEGKKNVIDTGALTSGGTAFTTTQGA